MRSEAKRKSPKRKGAAKEDERIERMSGEIARLHVARKEAELELEKTRAELVQEGKKHLYRLSMRELVVVVSTLAASAATSENAEGK